MTKKTEEKIFTFERLLLLFGLLQKGSKLLDSTKWKNRTIQTNLVVFIVALLGILASFGLNISLSEAEITMIAGAIVALFNVIMGAITDDEVGVEPEQMPKKIQEPIKKVLEKQKKSIFDSPFLNNER